jgi:hypothetical protein
VAGRVEPLCAQVEMRDAVRAPDVLGENCGLARAGVTLDDNHAAVVTLQEPVDSVEDVRTADEVRRLGMDEGLCRRHRHTLPCDQSPSRLRIPERS